MATKTIELKGGKKLAAYLNTIAAKLGKNGAVNVGFLENATYPADPAHPQQAGLKVAQVAFWNEFGTKNAPPRPFFRRMIAAKSSEWGPALGAIAKSTGYDTQKTLALVGTGIKDQLVQSIVTLTSPPLAESTVEKKGFDKPLIDTGVMQRAVDFEVITK